MTLPPDDEMDRLISDAARGYNEPPVTPRDEMWSRIAEARARQKESATVLPFARRWNAGAIAKLAAGIAAVLLVGVAIGRVSIGGNTGNPTVATTAPTPDQQIAMAPTESAGTARSGTRPRGDNTRSGAAQSGDRKGTNTKAPASSESRRSPAGPEQSLDPQTAARLYQLVALQHFGRTEALLTAFRADSRRGGDSAVNARIADWSRELLSTTRLLLDSPAADDPQMRSLLGDLEVLLAKLAQHSGAGGGDVKIINDALGQGELLNRLRTAVPAGAATDVQGE